MHVIPGYSINNAIAHCPYDHWLDLEQLSLSWQFVLFLVEQVTVRSSSIKNIYVLQATASSSLSQKCLNLQPLSGFTIIYPVILLLLPDDKSEFINTLPENSILQLQWFAIHGFCSYNQGSCQLSPTMIICCPPTYPNIAIQFTFTVLCTGLRPVYQSL